MGDYDQWKLEQLRKAAASAPSVPRVSADSPAGIKRGPGIQSVPMKKAAPVDPGSPPRRVTTPLRTPNIPEPQLESPNLPPVADSSPRSVRLPAQKPVDMSALNSKIKSANPFAQGSQQDDPQELSRGGKVTRTAGPKIGKEDGKIAVQKNEYVIRKAAEKHYGKAALDAVNSGRATIHYPKSKSAPANSKPAPAKSRSSAPSRSKSIFR